MFNRSNLLIVLAALAAGLGFWAASITFQSPAAGPGTSPVSSDAPPAVEPARMQAVRLHAPRPLDAFVLQGADGQPIDNTRLLGHWTVVFLGFTHCPDVCPTTLSELAKVQDAVQSLPEASRPRVLFVSVDPARDTPFKTGEYAAYFHADTLAATADEPALGQFASALGLVYMKVPTAGGDYTMDHSSALVLVDPQGRRAGLVQPPLQPAAIAADLRLLAKEAP